MKNNKPSVTAMLVAAGCLSVSRSPLLGSLVSAEWRNLLERFVATFPLPERWYLGLLARRPLRGFVEGLERLSVPGLSLHFVLRKRALELEARSAVTDGFTQVLVLGGGFDTLALRLAPQFPSVQFFELDHPATQGVKTGALTETLPNLHLASANFVSQPWEGVFKGLPGFSLTRDTLFLCEGVLMYLPPQEVNALFSALRQSVNARSRFLFTFMERQADGSFHFKGETQASRQWLQLKKESFLWGLPLQELEEFLKARGFSLLKLLGAEDLTAGVAIGDKKPAIGEWIVLADKLGKMHPQTPAEKKQLSDPDASHMF